MKSITKPVSGTAKRCQSLCDAKQQRRLNAANLASSLHRHALPLIALTACAWLLLPGRLLAQTSEASNNIATSREKSQTAQVMLVNDVPVGQPVTVTRALFDLGGYQIITQSGSTIAVPFVDHNLNVLRFGRSRDDQTYFVKEKEGEAPALYISPNFSLENAANASARWIPLGPNYSDRPTYVSMVPSYPSYAAMIWRPGMTWYGGVWEFSPNRAAWTAVPGSYINIISNLGNRSYTPNNYLTLAAGQTSFRSTSRFNYNPYPIGPIAGTTPPGSSGRSTPLQANGGSAEAAHPQQAPPHGSGPNNGKASNPRPGKTSPPPARAGSNSKKPHK